MENTLLDMKKTECPCAYTHACVRACVRSCVRACVGLCALSLCFHLRRLLHAVSICEVCHRSCTSCIRASGAMCCTCTYVRLAVTAQHGQNNATEITETDSCCRHFQFAAWFTCFCLLFLLSGLYLRVMTKYLMRISLSSG